MDRLTYPFDVGHEAGEAALAALLGGKGAGLARMVRLGIPVPPGFTIPVGATHRPELRPAILEALTELERVTGKRLGDPADPLLVSVRSGAARSMPGMMDTVLNVGMTPAAARGLAAASGDEEFARDTAARAETSYAAVVGHPPPAEPHAQVLLAVEAVVRSWDSPRAVAYREREGIAHDGGTAATVQAMVFGNLGEDSGTGVVFSRSPISGEPGLVGDFLPGAQGEDVVAGTHRTLAFAEMTQRWPELSAQLTEIADRLEHEYADMVDIEFTVERGRLWILQCRRGKRSPRATFRIAVDLAKDPSFAVDRDEAVARCADLLDDPPVDAAHAATGSEAAAEVARGLAASPGRAAGALCTDVDEAIARSAAGEPVVLVRRETSPADVAAMSASAGLVTTLGGLVSHAAVVARSWGIPAVVGAADLVVRPTGVIGRDGWLPAGALVTVDGDGGALLVGAHEAAGRTPPEVETIMAWAGRDGGEAPAVVPGADPVPSARAPNAAATRLGELGAEDVLRSLTLKGFATPTVLAGALGAPAEAIEVVLGDLDRDGLVTAVSGARFRATPEGRLRVDASFAAEAGRLGAAFVVLLADFDPVNVRFKALVARWQLRPVDGEEVPNDHSDPAYDRAVVDELATAVHPPITTLLTTASSRVPRLIRYAERLGAALGRLSAGDTSSMAHPLEDSYHTVWFELHEELIRLAGRTRAEEAEAGRA